ncbi:MAG TPA: lysine--tRNA ligase [Candidatus Kapabacteria bacterium]|nr:lysine--tRNA ligase [Candidatus Kapabacteria bacterium]
MLRPDNDQIARRYHELDELEASGVVAYPYSFEKTHETAAARAGFQDEAPRFDVAVAGRIVAIRRMGKASFAHIQDESGRLQIYLKKDDLPNYDSLRLFDLGDIVGVRGFMFRTRTGEVSVHAESFELLTKCLIPIPVPKEETDEEGNRIVHDQFSDKELRYRQRYLDLTVNPDVREAFRRRATMIRTIRRYLDNHGLMEVETPVLHTIYGGAAARPFSSHLNALDIPLYLRISLELNLKRLLVGGFEGVYELGKNFRNEGIDRTHNPEFTMLEFYVAYRDYTWMMEFIEGMLTETVLATNGSLKVETTSGTIDFTPPYRRATMLELVREKTGADMETITDAELATLAGSHGVHVDSTMGRGKIIDELFSELVQPTLIQPTFVMDFPVEMVPLAKRHRGNPALVEAFELIVNGSEIGPGFSELNDPRDQRARLEEQAKLRDAGDDEAMLIDEDFLHALSVGMPPAAGVGIGIDRLAMLLTGADSIRDVIFFPMMRPTPSEASEDVKG